MVCCSIFFFQDFTASTSIVRTYFELEIEEIYCTLYYRAISIVPSALDD